MPVTMTNDSDYNETLSRCTDQKYQHRIQKYQSNSNSLYTLHEQNTLSGY